MLQIHEKINKVKLSTVQGAKDMLGEGAGCESILGHASARFKLCTSFVLSGNGNTSAGNYAIRLRNEQYSI